MIKIFRIFATSDFPANKKYTLFLFAKALLSRIRLG